MAAAGLSFGFNFPGGQFPLCHHYQQRVLPALVTSHSQKPLPHSIDAILDKPTPSTSPSSDRRNTPPPPAAILPPFDVIARRVSLDAFTTSARSETLADVTDTSTSSVAESSPESAGSDVEEDGESEDVIVVDEAEEHTTAEDEHCTDMNADCSDVGGCTELDPAFQVRLSSGQLLTHDQPNTPSDTHCLPPSSSDNGRAEGGVAKTASLKNVNDSSVKAKSAFRPIVRPWLMGAPPDSSGDISSCTTMTQTTRSAPSAMTLCDSASSEKTLRGVTAAKQTPLSLTAVTLPLDAISMLRRQTSAFRVCGNRLNVGQGHVNINPLVHATTGTVHSTNGCMHKEVNNGTRVMIPGSVGVGVSAGMGLGVGQSLPGNMATWLSWLRAGQHLAPHPAGPTLHAPAQAAPRGILAPSNIPPHTPPQQQVPRYNCEACGKSYSTFGGLSKHKQFHCAAQVKKEFRCKFCDKSYSSLGALKMHIRTHTLPCKCSVCGKAFSRPWLLQGHVRTHTGEKPFSCTHCARAFADRSNLRAHLQTHSDIKKYCCRACSKTFSRMSLLVKHRESSCAALQR